MTHLQDVDSLTPPLRQRPFFLPAAATIVLLLGGLPAAAQSVNRLTVAAVDASALRDWDAAVDRLDRAGDLRRYDTRPNPFMANRQSERFAQYHEGVPVYGADLIRQTEAGVTSALLGTLFRGIDVDTTPGLTTSEARALFDEMSAPPFGLVGTPDLWVFPLGDGEYTLAYEGRLSSLRSVFIDADTGETLFEVSRMREQTIGLGTGVLGDPRKMATESIGGAYRTRDRARPAEILTFDLERDEERLLDLLRGDSFLSIQDLAADADNRWEDGAVVDVHAGLGWSYDYLANGLGWNGIDGAGGAITALVHPMDPDRVARKFQECLATSASPLVECTAYLILLLTVDNAVYIGPQAGLGGTGLMVFGEPFESPTPLTALDIVAHEMAHGVTYFTAGLRDTPPPNEPGALNEAFSDIIGTATEFYVQEPGDGPLRADYLEGEDAGFPIRSLRDPQELLNPITGPYPDHYDNLYRGREDFGGVHINATILGHAYFLAVEGGINRTSGLSVTGVGHENRLEIERTFFNAWVNLVPSFADHAIVGESLIRSATDLFGPGAPATRAIREALDAVGIPHSSGQMHTFNRSHDSGD